jgi:hypothetical protein
MVMNMVSWCDLTKLIGWLGLEQAGSAVELLCRLSCSASLLPRDCPLTHTYCLFLLLKVLIY